MPTDAKVFIGLYLVLVYILAVYITSNEMLSNILQDTMLAVNIFIRRPGWILGWLEMLVYPL